MLEDLLKHNRQWAAEREAADPRYFKRLASLQEPDYLWIGCSDSRVPANVITGLEPGEVFVHRNVANLIHPADLNMLSVVQYAVDKLKVRHIILCGHYGCGGIRAAIDDQQHGIVDNWIQPIRNTAFAYAEQLDKIEDKNERLDRLCELSIVDQVSHLANTPIMQQAWRNGRDITIHGWVYGLKDGLIRDLDCSVSQP